MAFVDALVDHAARVALVERRDGPGCRRCAVGSCVQVVDKRGQPRRRPPTYRSAVALEPPAGIDPTTCS
jgi:hypothetical protein